MSRNSACKISGSHDVGNEIVDTFKIKKRYCSETFVISAKLQLVSQNRAVLSLVGQKSARPLYRW